MSLRYTNDEFIEAVKTSTSIRQVLSKIGLKEAGGNYKVAQEKIKKLNLDTSHFTGKGWLKGKTHRHTTKPIEYYLTENSYHQSYKLKNRLIKDGIKEHKCEECGIIKWRGKLTPIELDHINGNPRDNRLENLRILCPNCHAQTETYRGKNKYLKY
jgi:Zn finger protein HypA/HybF involved in hydrogenase expression